MIREPHDIRFFVTRDEFWRWLEEHHATETEVWLGHHKRATGVPTLRWEDAVDAALCFGWIDGIRKGLDERTYAQRFTPRRKTSNWSAINLRRVLELEAMGLLRPAGRRAYDERDRRRDAIYTYEREAAIFSPEQEAQFRANEAAWAFFTTRAPSYQRTLTGWVTSAKQEATRERRLSALIEASAAGRSPGAIGPPPAKAPEAR